MTLRINSWSGPRNISTSFMYAIRQRSDTTVFDEPIYAHYLRVTGRDHPGRDDVLASQDPDGEAVVRDVILGGHPTPVAFFKQMAKHFVDLDRGFLGACRNILLIRDPARVVTSFAKNVPDVNVADTGLPIQVDLLDSILAEGEDPVVVDSATLLAERTRMKPLWYALAGGVAASRVHTRIHHASDVVAGAALGLALGRVVQKTLRLR